MPGNSFEGSRISEGTLHTGAQHSGAAWNESKALSRDDVRDGFAEPQISNMVAEGGPALGTSAMPEPAAGHRLYPVSHVVGERVQNITGEDLGKVEDLMLDPADGRIMWAILSFGGFFGIGDKRFPVPWKALRVDLSKKEIILDIDRAALDRAPNFDKDNWPNLGDPEFGREVHQHYGQAQQWEHRVTDAGDYTGEQTTPDRSREYEVTEDYRRAPRH